MQRAARGVEAGVLEGESGRAGTRESMGRPRTQQWAEAALQATPPDMLDAANQRGMTALMTAASHGFPGKRKFLLPGPALCIPIHRIGF